MRDAPMDIVIDTTVILDQRVIGAWNQDKIERFKDMISMEFNADEITDFPGELRIKFDNLNASQARLRVNSALGRLRH